VSGRVGRRPVLLVGQLAVDVPLIAALAGVGLFRFALRSVTFAYAPDVAPGEMGASTVGVLFGAQQIATAFCPGKRSPLPSGAAAVGVVLGSPADPGAGN
jgi:hypothetical protein